MPEKKLTRLNGGFFLGPGSVEGAVLFRPWSNWLGYRAFQVIKRMGGVGHRYRRGLKE